MPGISGNNLVEKSKSLVWAKFRDYTAGELRLLEVYLSRINPRDPNSATVRFSLAEYRDFLGLKNLTVKSIKPQIDHFLGNTVSIPINKEKGTFETYTLFTRARVDIDPGTGCYMVSISCNPDLRSVFFDIAESGYVKYRLRYTSKMKSQYSILLYAILRDWENTGEKTHTITLKELREQLGATEASYDIYKNLRKRVLDMAVDEINAVSDILVTYDTVRSGRKIVAIRFKHRIASSTPLVEAPVSVLELDVETDTDEGLKPTRKPRSAPYSDIDWQSIAPGLEALECIGIAKMVSKRLKTEFPEIKTAKRKAAIQEVVRNAYDKVLRERNPWPDNPAGYLYAVLNRKGAVGEYLPAIFTFGWKETT